jgi:TRAP-type mannitol/chloroaromatic compound transport system permease large subunit
MRTLAAWSARLTDALAIAFFVAMFACVLAQVVFRCFLGSPLTWSDELARYLFVWCAFLGRAIVGWMRGGLAQANIVGSVIFAGMSGSATIGPIIPPSLPMIVYGVAAETSIGALFLAGVLPVC